MKGVDKIMDIKTARTQLLAALPTFDVNIQEAIKTVLNLEELDKPDLAIKKLDEKHVEFNGRTYCKRKSGYYSRIEFLHVVAYEIAHGFIVPKNHEIHHKDFNPSNNDIDNLKMLTKSEHRKLHIKEYIANSPAAICEACGKIYQGRNINARFCSSTCQKFVNQHKQRGHFNDDGSFKIEYLQNANGRRMLTLSEIARQYIRLHPTQGFNLTTEY